MTEAEWYTTKDPWAMLACLKTSPRQDRLVLVACCRLQELDDIVIRKVLTSAERYADGKAKPSTINANKRKVARLSSLLTTSVDLVNPKIEPLALNLVELATTPIGSSCRVGSSIMQPVPQAMHLGIQNEDLPASILSHLPAILRELFGNPFHPITLSPSWLTSTVVSLANQMYDTRDFSAMSILADALQDAGCSNEEILEHCRGPGAHVRGCWACDLLTGRE